MLYAALSEAFRELVGLSVACFLWLYSPERKRARICTRRLISEARLPSGTVPWDNAGQGQRRKVAALPGSLLLSRQCGK